MSTQSTLNELVDAMGYGQKSLPTIPAPKGLEFQIPASPTKKCKLRSIEGYLLGPSRKRARVSTHKSVRFHCGDSSIRVIPRSVFKEDLAHVWYNGADYRSFRDDSKCLALAFDLGILDRIHPDDFCLRGLEASLSSAHLEARLAARGTMIDVVLSTQEAQRGHGIRDPEMIRGLSLMLSKDACEDALKLAQYDREEAEAVMAEGLPLAC